MTKAKPAYKRILLKLSGEALMGDDAFGINRATIERIVAEIAEVTQMGVQVAVVIGGGNIFRGVAGGSAGMDRATADYMGMLATVMNALALADAMNHQGVVARVMSAIAIEQVVDRPDGTAGFSALKDAGLENFAFETVVLRYPDSFSRSAIERARERMEDFGYAITL